MLEKGFVKVFIFQKSNKEDILYNLQKKTNKSEFVSEYYNAQFQKTKDVHYSIQENSFVEKKKILYRNNKPFKLKIIEPMTFTFSSNKLEFKSNYKFPKNGYYSTSLETTQIYFGKSQIIYKGDTVNCIVYKSDELKTETNEKTSKERSKSLIGKMYFGEGYGYIYHEIFADGDTIKFILKNIIDTKEFENLKKIYSKKIH